MIWEECFGHQIVLADPAWRYGDRNCNGAAEQHYPTMSIEAIRALPVGDLCAPDCALFLWATYPLMREALSVIEAWGFTYKSIAFQWVKTYPNGKPFFGLGRWTRGNSEPCLLATRGKPKRVSASVGQLVFTDLEAPEELLISPVTRHSAKPPEVRDRIVTLMGELPRVELFARTTTPGWSVWGNDVKSDVTL